jgi:hypothetical protein
MSDVIHKIIQAKEYYEGSPVSYVTQAGYIAAVHPLPTYSGYYSGVITKMDARFPDIVNVKVIP